VLSQKEPADQALESIASILDGPRSHDEPSDLASVVASFFNHYGVEQAVTETKPSEEVIKSSEIDPTEVTLATIADILDNAGSSHIEPETVVIEEQPDSSAQIEADGYSRVGPGPIMGIRFKWTIRREGDGEFFVDESIGKLSLPVSSGPMSADAAIRFVDDQHLEAHRRFDAIKSEMSGRAA
jgi:hypothetical protein